MLAFAVGGYEILLACRNLAVNISATTNSIVAVISLSYAIIGCFITDKLENKL